MSTATRDSIAAALNSAGVTGHPHQPTVLADLAAWPRFTGATAIQRINGRCRRTSTTYDVLTVLPASTPQVTDDAAEQLLGGLLDALSPMGLIGDIRPVAIIVADSTTVAALSIQLTVPT